MGRSTIIQDRQWKWNKQAQKLSRAVQLQQSYIDTYNWLKGKNKSDFGYGKTGLFYMKYTTVNPIPHENNKYVNKIITFDQLPGTIKHYRNMAIQAEMGGLAKATKHLRTHQANPFDPASVGSSRTTERNSRLRSAKKLKKAQQALSDKYGLTTYTTTGKVSTTPSIGTVGFNKHVNMKKGITDRSNMSELQKAQQALSDKTGITTYDVAGNVSTTPSIGSTQYAKNYYDFTFSDGSTKQIALSDYEYNEYMEMHGRGEKLWGQNMLSVKKGENKLKKAQQKLSDDWGVVTFNKDGTLSTIPTTGNIRYDLLGLTDKKGNPIKGAEKKFKKQVMEQLLTSNVSTQLQKSRADEKSLQLELDKIDERISNTKSRKALKSLMDKRKKIYDKIQTENTIQSDINMAYASTDRYNTIIQSEVEKGNISRGAQLGYMYMNKPEDTILIDQMQYSDTQAGKFEIILDSVKGDLDTYRNLIGRSGRPGKNNRKKNTKQDKERLDKFISEMKNYYGLEGDDVKSVIADLRLLRKQSKKAMEQSITEKQNLFMLLQSDKSSKEKLAYAEQFNKNVKARKYIEEEYDIDTRGMTAKQVMKHVRDMTNEDLDVTSAVVDYIKDKRISKKENNRDWYSSWLTGEYIHNTSGDDSSFAKYGKVDSSNRGKLSGWIGVLNKYHVNWAEAQGFIGGQVSKWNSDVTGYYKTYSSTPTVTKQYVLKSVWGTDKIVGDSFVNAAIFELGQPRGGAYWQGDIRNIIRKTQSNKDILEQQVINYKDKIKQLKQTKEQTEATHAALSKKIPNVIADKKILKTGPTIDNTFKNELTKSADETYDARFALIKAESELEYLEKSIDETDIHLEQLIKDVKRAEYQTLHESEAPVIRRIRTPSRRPSLRSVSRRGRSGMRRKRTRSGKSLGGLVV